MALNTNICWAPLPMAPNKNMLLGTTIKGPAPRRRTVGDKEQWAFKDVELTGGEKKMVVGVVVSIATLKMKMT